MWPVAQEVGVAVVLNPDMATGVMLMNVWGMRRVTH